MEREDGVGGEDDEIIDGYWEIVDEIVVWDINRVGGIVVFNREEEGGNRKIVDYIVDGDW